MIFSHTGQDQRYDFRCHRFVLCASLTIYYQSFIHFLCFYSPKLTKVPGQSQEIKNIILRGAGGKQLRIDN